jgi:hypothetical protein
LANDTLSSIRLNHEWRELVASALIFYFTDYDTELGIDNEEKFNALLSDLYTLETNAMQRKTTLTKRLTSSKTTSSLTFVDIAETGFSHTPIYQNMQIEIFNLGLSFAAAGDIVDLNIKCNQAINSLTAFAQMSGTAAREMACILLADNLTPNVPLDFELEWRVSGGTVTLSIAPTILIIISEWE